MNYAVNVFGGFTRQLSFEKETTAGFNRNALKLVKYFTNRVVDS